jgi:hypothetical protein
LGKKASKIEVKTFFYKEQKQKHLILADYVLYKSTAAISREEQ